MHQFGPSELKALYRFLRVPYFVLLGAVAAYWLVAEGALGITLPRIDQIENLSTIKLILVLVALADAVVVVYFRYSRIASLLRQPASNSAHLLGRLRADYLVCFVVSNAVAVYGFALRLLGGSREDALPFFVGAVVLFMLCYPRSPESTSTPGGPIDTGQGLG
ncbi:hypothetical protein MYX77_02485 [Acidobacteriia bacterium AH_259_A11_L15]|nr:hypothetical protein [Acidobacteriia bacterium AH_259_A11_L15]